jgi:hypothetical protein
VTNISGLIGIGLVALAFIPLLLGGVFVILIVANRAEPDPSGRRPVVVYQFATSFVTVFATLFATFAIVTALCQLIGHNPGGFVASFGGSQHPVGDAVARQAVLGALVAIVAGATLAGHRRRGLDNSAGDLTPLGPLGRVRLSYASAVSFVCVLIVIVATVVAVYQLFKIIGPGVFGHGGSRVAPLRVLLPDGYLAVAAGSILSRHRRLGQLPPPAPAPLPPLAPSPVPPPVRTRRRPATPE